MKTDGGPAREECTCVKLPGGGRLPMDDCTVHGSDVVEPSWQDVAERLDVERLEHIAEIKRLREWKEDATGALINAGKAYAELFTENAKLREFFEVVFKDLWDLHDPDGGDLQDTAERLGLIVKVPADEQFRDEYDGDEMFVWSWSPLATEALSHHLPPDDGDTG